MELTIRVGERIIVSYGDIGYTKKSKASNVEYLIYNYCFFENRKVFKQNMHSLTT